MQTTAVSLLSSYSVLMEGMGVIVDMRKPGDSRKSGDRRKSLIYTDVL